jgi:tetratricopeptide (TPR) repeat protein
MTSDPSELAEQGKRAFQNKKFKEAAELFREASKGFTEGRSGLMAAEMDNNLSVALLQAGNPQGALEAALGTDEVFAGAKDVKRRAIAIANQASALEALGSNDEAIAKYERAADLFAGIDEGDMRSIVLKSSAAIKLKTGRITESAFKMIGSMDVKKNPSIFERIMRSLLRFIIK